MVVAPSAPSGQDTGHCSTPPRWPQHSAVGARGTNRLRSEYSVLGLNSNSSFLLGPGYTTLMLFSFETCVCVCVWQCHVIAWDEAP